MLWLKDVSGSQITIRFASIVQAVSSRKVINRKTEFFSLLYCSVGWEVAKNNGARSECTQLLCVPIRDDRA